MRERRPARLSEGKVEQCAQRKALARDAKAAYREVLAKQRPKLREQ